MAGIGFTNKKDLPKWDEEDTKKAKSCMWMMNQKYKNYPDSVISRYKECMWWNTKLHECLPSPELYDYCLDINSVSIVFKFNIFESKVKHARYMMVMKLQALEFNKAEMIRDYATKQQTISSNINKVDTLEEYRNKQLAQTYPMGTPNDKKQKEEKVIGYVPTREILKQIPPMEVIDYCGFRLIKYDRWHGFYAIMLVSPDGDNKKIEIMYDENALKIELKAECKFDELIENYLQSQKEKNPYGNKVYNNVDISKINKAMGYDKNKSNNDPLNRSDIF